MVSRVKIDSKILLCIVNLLQNHGVFHIQAEVYIHYICGRHSEMIKDAQKEEKMKKKKKSKSIARYNTIITCLDSLGISPFSFFLFKHIN